MSQFLLKIDLGAQLSLRKKGASIYVELFLSATLALTDVENLLKSILRCSLARFRKVLDVYLKDDKAE